MVLVFDPFVDIAPANRLKKGYVTAEGAANWPIYKQNAKKLVLREFAGVDEDACLIAEEKYAEWGSPGPPGKDNATLYSIKRTENGRVTFIEPTERLGFGLAVRSALRAVETPYVWVQQHDWKLEVDIPVESILEVMAASDPDGEAPVKYVCLPSIRLLSYATSNHVTAFPELRQATATLKKDFAVTSRIDETIPLTPLFFWHDKTHIALTAHYLQRVFPSRLAMPRGTFIEDHIGQRARNQMKEGQWKKWACWLYYPRNGQQACLVHLKGRHWRGIEAEKKKIEAFRLENGSLIR